MKKLFLIAALLLCPLFGRTQVATTGYHRVNQVLTRAPQSITAQVVPNAKIAVTNTATGLAATIYSDPLLTNIINPPLLTADNSGNYSYYVALNYCVTETISSPGQSQPLVIPNICANSSGGTVLGLDANGTPVTPTAGVFNFTATSPLVLTPSGNTFNYSCPTCGTSSGGTSVSVNGGSVLGSLNLNATTPSADTSFLSLTPKISGSNAIIETPYANGSQYGVTIYASGGSQPWLGYIPAQAFSLTNTGIGGPATYTSNVINIPQYQCGLTLTTSGGSGASTLSGCTLNIPQYAGGGASLTNVLVSNPSIRAGSQQSYDAIPSITPICDIRAYGAVINGTTPIDSAVQTCINAEIASGSASSGVVYLPCVKLDHSGNPGCVFNNPSLITGLGSVKIQCDGGIQLGSTYIAPNGASTEGTGIGNSTQFQFQGAGCTFWGPNVVGALGTSLTANTPSIFTPTFTSGSIAQVPTGSAITLVDQLSCTGGTGSTTAGGYATLTFSGSCRIPPGANVTVTGCSNTAFNTSQNVVSDSNYPNQTLSYYSTATSGTATGCTAIGPNDDSYETVDVTNNGTTLTVTPVHNHLSTAKFSAVAVKTAYNETNGTTWNNLSIVNCYGACFDDDQGIGDSFHNFATACANSQTCIPFDAEMAQWMKMDGITFLTANPSATCPSGGCPVLSYPWGMRCTVPAASVIPYDAVQACGDSAISSNSSTSFIHGGIHVDENNTNVLSFGATMPRINGVFFEEAIKAAVVLDNRATLGVTPLIMGSSRIQDNIIQAFGTGPFFAYTDQEPTQGNYICTDCTGESSPTIGNSLFNAVSADTVGGLNATHPAIPYNSAGISPIGTFHDNGVSKTENEGEDQGFGPSVLPGGSLPITTSAAGIVTTCNGAGFTATAITGPDGLTSGVEADATSGGGAGATCTVGTDSVATYTGDIFLIKMGVRAGTGQTYPSGPQGTPWASFLLSTAGTDTWANASYAGHPAICFPNATGLQMAGDGWMPQVALCVVGAGDSTPHNINFQIVDGSAVGTGNQAFNPAWVFIPGPNNPAYVSGTTPTLTEVQRWQQFLYHGFVPPNLAAGSAVTGEQVVAPSFKALGGAAVLYRCSGGTSDGAILVSGSTLATTCTTGGGSLVILGITTL